MHLDVGVLAQESRSAVDRWIRSVEAKPKHQKAMNVERNLTSLVHVGLETVPRVSLPGGGIMMTTINKTS